MNTPLKISLAFLHGVAVLSFFAAILCAAVPVSLREGMAYPGGSTHVQSTHYRFVPKSSLPRVTVTDEFGAWTEIRTRQGEVLGHTLTQATIPTPILYLPYYPFLCIFPENYSRNLFLVLSVACTAFGGWMLHVRRKATEKVGATS